MAVCKIPEDKKFCKKSIGRSMLLWYRRHSLVLCVFSDVSFVSCGKRYKVTMFLFSGNDARRKCMIVIFTVTVFVLVIVIRK